jgi:hypothetical protein
VSLTLTQRRCLVRVFRATSGGEWYRGGQTAEQTSGGERVTLSSLHSKGLLDRQLRDDDRHAYEYRASATLMRLWGYVVVDAGGYLS